MYSTSRQGIRRSPDRRPATGNGPRISPLALALLAAWGALPAAAQNTITLTGHTDTDVSDPVNGVTNIHTNTVHGNSGFNSFGHFTVGAGNTVNLHVPTGAANLVNLVNDSAVQINGTLNGMKDGAIGGNIFFASSHGFVVGASGVLNVGSLLVTTPSAEQMDFLGEIARSGDAAAANSAVETLLLGGFGAGSGAITIDGRVNSAGAINLFAASAMVASTGELNAGSRVFGATVNQDGVVDATAATRRDGEIVIVARDGVGISGALAAMLEDESGGGVRVFASSIDVDGSITTRAAGAGESGDITLQAYSDVGCTFCVAGEDVDDAVEGVDTIDDLAAELKSQASPLLQAKLGKATVTIGENAVLDAGHDDDGASAGDVTVEAFAFDRQMAGYAEATSAVDVAGTIIGRDIDLRAASHAHVSGDILNSLLNTAGLAADIEALAGTFTGTDEEKQAQAWSQVFDTLHESVDYQRVTDLDLLGLNPENFSELSVLLPYLSVMIARANADVTVRSGAVLDAARDLDLQADSTRLVQAETFALPFANKKMPFNFGLAYGRIDGRTAVEVEAGARLEAGNDLGIRALSNDTLNVSATSVNNHDAAGNTLTTMGLAFSMAHSDISTDASIAGGAALDVAGSVDMVALTEQDLSNSADFKAIGDGATGGPAIALTLFNSNTRAAFDADLDGAAGLSVSATNLVHGQSNSASVQTGKGSAEHLKKEVMGSQEIKGVTDAIGTKVNALFGKKPGAEKTPEQTDSKFRLAAALAIGISDHQAEAVIGSGASTPDIQVGGDLAVQALQRQASMHNSAESTVNADAEKEDGSKVSISIAAAYDQLEQQTRALVGDGSSLAGARIGIGARNEQLLDLGAIDRWSSMSEIFDNLKDLAESLPEIPGRLSTSYANSSSESEDFSLAGSVAASWHALDATAWVGDGVTLAATGADAAPWSSKPLLVLAPVLDDDGEPDEAREAMRNIAWTWDAPLAVQADTFIQRLSIAGNLWWTLFNTTADGDDGKAVGGGVNVQVATNRTVAGIGAGGTVEAEAVNVSADQDELVIGISPSAGKGTSVAGNGAVVVGVVDADVAASIHHATVVEAGQVGISAGHDIGLWSAAGALAVSQETSIGVGIAVNVLTSDVEAFVGGNNGVDGDGGNLWRPDAMGAGAIGGAGATWQADEVLVDAKSSGQSGAFGIAGALARSEQEQQEQDDATESDGGAGKGGTELLSGAGAQLLAKFGLSKLGLESGVSAVVDYASQIKEAVSNPAGQVKGALDGAGDAADKPENQLALAGSASVNVSGQNTRATISGITLDPRDPARGSDVNVLALNQTNQFSGAGAGALTLSGGPKADRSSAVAGAIAYNHLFNVTEALVEGATFNDSDGLRVQAASAGDQVALGLGLAVATSGNDNTAVGFSASGGVVTNTTRAAVVDSRVDQRDAAGEQAVEVHAYDRSRTLLGGGAFAGTSGKGTSAGGSLVIGYLGNTLEAEWLGSHASGFDRFDVTAGSATRVLGGAIAGAVSTGSDSTAGTGSAFVLIVDNDVGAKVDASDNTDHSSLQGGDVGVRAGSVSGLSALDALFDDAATTTLSGAGLDLDGSDSVAGIEVEATTDDSVFGADNDDSTTHGLFQGIVAGEAILGVAGSLSLSNGKAVGISAGGVYTGSDYAATIANTDISLDGDLEVRAHDSTQVLAAAVSGALGNADMAGAGSVAAIIARGTVKASLDMSGRSDPLRANSLNVDATRSGAAYSLAGSIAGSAGDKAFGAAFSINDMQQGATATVTGGRYELEGDATIGAAQNSHVITAALSGSISGSDLALGGAGTFNRIADTTTATLHGAHLAAANLAVSASQPQLGARIWSLAFNLAASGGASAGGAALAVNLVDAERTAKVSDSTVDLDGDATLESSLDGEIWGFAIDAAGGSGNAAGASIVVNNIDGKDEVLVENSTITTTDAGGELLLDASAGDGLKIASLTGSIKGGGSNAVGGAISVNRIGADRTAAVRNRSGDRISGFADASLLSGAQQDIYAIAVAGGGAGNVAVNGSSTTNILQGTERAAVEGGQMDVGSLSVSAARGDRTIWSLAGAVSGAGSVAVGVANANNVILAARQAEVSNADLVLDGALLVESGGDANIRSAAVGGGGAGTAAAGASIAINVVDGEESAVVADSTLQSADAVTVQVTRGEADIKTLAGNVQGAGTGAGAGAVAISTIGQEREARVSRSNLDHVAADIEVLAATNARIDTLAISGAGAGTGALAFSNTSNNISAGTRALVEDSGGSAGKFSILASDGSRINAISGGIAAAGTVGGGAATAINRIDSDIEAAMTGARAGGWNLSNLVIDADSSADILSVAIGGGAGGTVGVGAAVATNIVQTASTAHASEGASVIARNNVGISASNADSILGIAGGIGGAGTAAVGASVTVNLVESETAAYIAGSATEISALGLDPGDTLLVDSGELLNAPLDDRQWFDEDAVADNGTAQGDDTLDDGWLGADLFNPAPNLGIGQHEVTGLAVQASSVQQVGQLSLALAFSVVPLGSASVSGLFNTSVLSGSTGAWIDSAAINQASGAGAAQDVRVGAASHSFSAGYQASIGLSLGWAGVAAGLDSTVIKRETGAGLHGVVLDSRGDTTVKAASTQFASSVVTAAGGGVAGAAGAAQLTILEGTTEAVVDGRSALDVGTLGVKATALQVVAPNVATLSVGAAAVGGGFGLVHNRSTTRAWVGEALVAPDSVVNTTVDAGAVDISASNAMRLQMLAAGASAGGGAFAGTAAVSIIETETEAGASQARFGSAGNPVGHLAILASDSLHADVVAGSVAAGGTSVGGSANVLVANSAVRALFDRASATTSGDFSVQALRETDVSMKTVTGSAAFGTALGGSIGVLVLGSGATSVNEQGESVDPMDELDQGGNGTLSHLDGLGGGDKVQDVAYQDYVLNPDTGEYELVDRTSAAAAGSINDSSRASAGGDRLQASTTYVHETVARVGDSSVTAGGDALVHAQDRLRASNLVGNAAVGGTAGVGGAFGLGFSNARVNAEVLGGTLHAADIDVTAEATGLAAGVPSLEVKAVSGAAGFGAGLGAAVGVAVVNNQVGVDLGGGLESDGRLQALALDAQDIEVDALGVAGGLVAGAGLVLGVSAHDSAVTMSVSPGAALAARDIDLAARSKGAATLTGIGSSGGLAAGLNATVLVARDDSSALLEVGEDAELKAGEDLSLVAEARPHASADSLGVAIGGLLSAGATVADAQTRASATVDLGDNVLLRATDATITSRVGLNDDRDSVNVSGLGVSGGVGIAVNAVVANAHSETTSRLQSADSVRFEGLGGEWLLGASTHVRQRAGTEGYAGGLLTVGAHVARATAETTTEALVNGRFDGGFDGFGVSAAALVDNRAESSAGQGGLVSGAASTATTRDDSTTRAVLHALGADGGAAALGALGLSALHQSRFNGFVDSTNAALVGMSGSNARNTVDLDTSATLAGGSNVLVAGYDQSARNEVTKAASSQYNVKSGSGGVIDAAAASSASVLRLDADSNVGADATLRLDGDWRAPEHLRITAFNSVDAHDRTRLDSGGAIAIALAESSVDVERARAGVSIGSGADLYSIGDLVLSASGRYDIDTSVHAKTWGLAGAAQGSSLSRVNADHDVTVAGGDSELFSYGDMKLYAGYDAAGAMNKATLIARTDLWNNTAFPVENDPEAVAEYLRDATLELAAGSHGRSVGDIHLYAGTGYSVLTGKGVGKDLYREGVGKLLGVSLDITGGRTSNGGAARVVADGVLDAGVHSQQKLHISGLTYFLDGVEIDPADVDESTAGVLTVAPVITEIGDGITYSIRSGEYTQMIGDRIAVLEKRISDYGISPVEKAAFTAELELLRRALDRIYARLVDGPVGPDDDPQLGGLDVWIMDIDPVLARPGNILVEGHALTGGGQLNAPGDAKIEILNQSELFLDLQGLEIPNREGGQLRFNGALMATNADINAANRAGLGSASFSAIETALNSPVPEIIVENSYNPAHGLAGPGGMKPPAPDIYVNGRIDNRRGNISLNAAYGSIYADADIRGQSLSISAGQDFVLTNLDGFTHIGGDPASNNADGSLTGPVDRTVAGNNVVINALYLNINGLVQSGVADWSVVINESDFAGLAVHRSRWILGTGPAVVQLAATDALTGRIGYSYDFRTGSIILDEVSVGGGYMELTGHIMSTGNGELRVLDGYSRVNVVNNTTRDLDITGIDLGNGVEGLLRINDVGRAGGDEVWSTIYTYNNDRVQRYEGAYDQVQATAPFLMGSTAGRGSTYDIADGRTYVWLEGTDGTATRTRVVYWDHVWGFIPSGDGTELYVRVVQGPAKPIDGAEYMGSLEKVPGLAPGQVHGALDQRFETSEWEDISKQRGGYCKAHFIWCQEYRTTETTISQWGYREIDRYTVRADQAIAINFIGYQTGRIDLTSNGSVGLLGSMFNESGTTTITVNQGDLTQANDHAVVAARDLVLAARDGIGGGAQALRVQVGDRISAGSARGSIDLAAIGGGLDIDHMQAAGDVSVTAQGDITSSSGATITGQGIRLVSSHGAIGAPGDLLNLDTGSDSRSLLSAEAVGGIHVRETHGDLWLDQVKAGGDVHIVVADGDLLDGNTTIDYEERPLAQLQALWEAMGLTGQAATDALEAQKEALVMAGNQRYDRYWQLRKLKPDGDAWISDPFSEDQAEFTTQQYDQLIRLNWTAEQIAAEEKRRIAEYKALHDEFGGTDYSESFQYALSDADVAQLDGTAEWTEDELRYSISAALLARDSGGAGRVEEMNIQGRDVTLQANRIGRLLDEDMVIRLDVDPFVLTPAQRAALAGAEFDDVYTTFDDDDNLVEIRIVQRDDVNLAATGEIRATAIGDVYLGGEQDFNIYDVRGETIHIKTDGSIVSANGSNVVIRGHDVVLEAADSAIRGDAATGDGSLHLEVSGELAARARELDLVHHGNLAIQRLIGTDWLRLQVHGDLAAAMQVGENLLGGSVDLAVTGDAGAADARIQIGTGGIDDRINLDIGGNAWIGGLQGSQGVPLTLRFNNAAVGGLLDIGQVTDLLQYGDWDVGSLVVHSGNTWWMDAGTRLLARDGIFSVAAGNVTLDEVETTADGSDIDITANSLAAAADDSRWTARDLLRLDASADIGSMERHVRLAADRLDVASATGNLYLDLGAGIGSGSLYSAGSQWLRTLGNVQLTSVTSAGGSVQLRGVGRVGIGALQAPGTLDLQGEDLVLGTAESTHGDIIVDVDTLAADHLLAGGDWTLSGHAAAIGTATVGGDVAQALTGPLVLGTLDAAGTWTLDGADAVIDTARVVGQVDMALSGDLSLNALEGGAGWNLQAGNADVRTATLAGDVDQSLAGDLQQETLLAGGDWRLDADTASVDEADVGGNVTQSVADTLTLGRLAAGGDWTLSGHAATIGTATVGGDVAQVLTGPLALGTLDAAGTWTLDGADAVIDTARVAGQVDMALSGDLSLNALDAGADADIAAGNASHVGRLGVVGDLLLQVANNLALGQAVVGGAARLVHTGPAGDLGWSQLQVGDTLSVTGAGDWTGGTASVAGDVDFDVGSAALGSLQSLAGNLDLLSARAFAAGELHGLQGHVDLLAGSTDLGNASAASTLDVHVTGGPLRILTGRSGDNLRLTAEPGSLADIHFGVPADPQAPDVLVQAHLESGRDILVMTDGDIHGGNAEAQGEVRLIGRNISVGRVQSLQHDVFMQAEADIFGLLVEAQRDVAIIAGGDLDMPDVRFGGTYSLKAGNDLRVGIGGNLDVGGIAEAGRDLTFTIGGMLDLAGIKAGRHVNVDAGGAIRIDEDIDAGGDISLSAGGDIFAGGRIFSAGEYLGDRIAGDVNLAAGGNVHAAGVVAHNGAIHVDGHHLGFGDMFSSEDIDLLARGSIQVGSSQSGGHQDWRADGGIGFDRLLAGAQAYLDGLLGVRGGLLRSEGDATVHAGWRGGQASDADALLGEVHAPNLHVFAGNRIRVEDGHIGTSADLHGRDIGFHGRHTGGGRFVFTVEGSGEPWAEQLDAGIDASDLLVPRLYAVDATIRTTSDLVEIRDAQYVDYLRLFTPQATLLMDNLSPAHLAAADVQFHELDKAFTLLQDGLVTTTNAYVVHRRYTHQVLVPNFQQEHEVDTELEYQRNSAASYGEQHLSEGFTSERTAGLRGRMFAYGQSPADWELAWYTTPADALINLSVDGEDGEEDEEDAEPRNLGAMLWGR